MKLLPHLSNVYDAYVVAYVSNPTKCSWFYG